MIYHLPFTKRSRIALEGIRTRAYIGPACYRNTPKPERLTDHGVPGDVKACLSKKKLSVYDVDVEPANRTPTRAYFCPCFSTKQ